MHERPPMEHEMFGCSGGEPESASVRKDQDREDAKSRWLCLDTMDLARVTCPDELVPVVKGRHGAPEGQARVTY